MRRLLFLTAFGVIFQLPRLAAADQTAVWSNKSAPPAYLQSNGHPNRYWDVKKLLGVQNIRIVRARKAGKIDQAQAKELFKKVTAGFQQIAVFAKKNGWAMLTPEQADQVVETRNKAREAIDAVLGPADPVTPVVPNP
jgi:hypothetical protein